MSTNQFDSLKLENQLCFPLYVCSKEIVKAYTPFLEKIGLTYTQYVVMMVLWEYSPISSRALGKKVFLEANTLSPLLKRLEAKGLLFRKRSDQDKRDLIISLSDKGKDLKNQALNIPEQMAACAALEPEKAIQLYTLLYELLDNLTGAESYAVLDT